MIHEKQGLDSFLDTEPYWVIWQVARRPTGGSQIRRISQVYRTEETASSDAERFRKSGAITWVEEARPLVPTQVPAEALEALGATDTSPDSARVTPEAA